ncbi:MAG: hypothetical protein ACYDCI_01710 [Candidatus Limnocylindrales bacterium]
MTRTTTTTLTGRASAMRRLRRRSAVANPLYCRTNGCTSFLEPNSATGTATCRICGYVLKLS